MSRRRDENELYPWRTLYIIREGTLLVETPFKEREYFDKYSLGEKVKIETENHRIYGIVYRRTKTTIGLRKWKIK